MNIEDALTREDGRHKLAYGLCRAEHGARPSDFRTGGQKAREAGVAFQLVKMHAAFIINQRAE